MVKHGKRFGLWVFGLSVLVVLSSAASFAADKEHGTVIREATLQVSPGPVSEKLAEVDRGSGLCGMRARRLRGKMASSCGQRLLLPELERALRGLDTVHVGLRLLDRPENWENGKSNAA